MNKLFKKVIDGETLTEAEMAELIEFIMDARASNDDLAPFLTSLAARGESVDEIVGAARVLRARAVKLNGPDDTVDCCGTGGDRAGTFNISTAVAIVAASCGVPVAKHGNRASSSLSGAADVLEKLGVNLGMTPAMHERALRELNFTFMAASRHHPGMKHVAVVRKKLGVPTIFNLLGPLANPAGATLQLLGVYDRTWLRPMAESLLRLGSARAWIVHGMDGLDEISISGPTALAMLADGAITETTLTPDDFGLPVHPVDALKGGDASFNAAALRAVLEGQKGAYRDIVLANTAAVLAIHSGADDLKIDLKTHVKTAAKAIDSGAASKMLRDYIALSREDDLQ